MQMYQARVAQKLCLSCRASWREKMNAWPSLLVLDKDDCWCAAQDTRQTTTASSHHEWLMKCQWWATHAHLMYCRPNILPVRTVWKYGNGSCFIHVSNHVHFARGTHIQKLMRRIYKIIKSKQNIYTVRRSIKKLNTVDEQMNMSCKLIPANLMASSKLMYITLLRRTHAAFIDKCIRRPTVYITAQYNTWPIKF